MSERTPEVAKVRHPRVLLVDDDRGMLETLADILGDKGFEVIAEDRGEKAIQVGQEESIDCMISDIRMPGMTGVELAHRLREIRPGLPVALITAYHDPDALAQVRSLGIPVFNKPLDIPTLLGTVLEQLGAPADR